MVDWRAPVAEPFYRATGRDPMGLVLRRHLAAQGRTIVGIEDERFGADDAREVASPGRADNGEALEPGLDLGGPGALLAVLGGARTGAMRDIVSTIQREQDEIIRSPLPGVLVVQGGPGTGKTAVALHRAAYLLYTHRFPLERQGVLVIGPNPLFLRYIEQVLPSLGESGVTLSTVTGLVHGVEARGEDDFAVARLKGEARMADVVARAIRTRQRPLRQDVEVPFGAAILRLSAAESASIVAAARRRPGTHNRRRRFVEQLVVRRLADEYVRYRTLRSDPEADGAPDVDLDLSTEPRRTVPVGLDVGRGIGFSGDDEAAHTNGAAARNGTAYEPGGDTDLGDTDLGDTDLGDTDLGDTDLGDTDLGDTDLGDAGNGDAGNGDAGNGDAGNGDAGRRRPGGQAWSGSDGEDGDALDLTEFSRQVRRVPSLAEALDRMWPQLSAEELLHDLYGARPLLQLAGRGLLTAAEQHALLAALSQRQPGVDPLDGGGHGPARRGPGAAGGTPGPGRRRLRPRGLAPHLRPHRGGRGAGPLAHGAAHGGSALVVGLDHRGGRHRPGHRGRGPRPTGAR